MTSQTAWTERFAGTEMVLEIFVEYVLLQARM